MNLSTCEGREGERERKKEKLNYRKLKNVSYSKS